MTQTAPVTPLQAASERAMEEVADALRGAQRVLRLAETAARRNLRGKHRGPISADVLRSAPVNGFRSPVDEALRRLEQEALALRSEVPPVDAPDQE